MRSSAQVISYELAMGLSLVSVFLMSGSMSTSQIVAAQGQFWWAFTLFPAFVIYCISAVGEVNRLPFDLPEAEGEIVAGHMTEYSSMKFGWYYLSEYVNMLNVSAVATTMFFGGWHAPWPLSHVEFLNSGWWGLLCFMLQGSLGQCLIARLGAARTHWAHAAALAGAGLLVLFPALRIRMFGHTALAGTWLILAALCVWAFYDRLCPTTLRACLWVGLCSGCWGPGFICIICP